MTLFVVAFPIYLDKVQFRNSTTEKLHTRARPFETACAAACIEAVVAEKVVLVAGTADMEGGIASTAAVLIGVLVEATRAGRGSRTGAGDGTRTGEEVVVGAVEGVAGGGGTGTGAWTGKGTATGKETC